MSDTIDPSVDPDDPTYSYFLLFAAPPPESRNLPDARTDEEAILAAQEVARDYAATVHLRHHAVDGTRLLGTVTPDGVFTAAAPATDRS